MLRRFHRIPSLSKDSALRRRWGVLPSAALLAALVFTLALVRSEPPAALAATGSLRVDPPAQTVAAGQAFTVKIIQNADAATLGAQTNFKFNPAVVQTTSVQVGAVYNDAVFVYGVQNDGSAASIEAAIAAANRSGVLRNLTTVLTPGTRSVPPGDAEFLSIGMTAKAGGKIALELVPFELFTNPDGSQVWRSPIEMLDEELNSIPVTTQNGEVTVTGGAASARAATPTVAAASATPEPSATADPAVAAARANASATLSISSGGRKLAVGDEAKVELRIKSNVKATQAQADISFDNSIIEVTKVEAGSSWKGAKVSVGTGRQTVEQAISDGNDKGELKSAGVLLLRAADGETSDASTTPTPSPSPAAEAAVPAAAVGTQPVVAATASPTAEPATTAASPTGGTRSQTPSSSGQSSGSETTFLVLTVKGLKNGETALKLKNAEVLGEDGQPIKVTAQDATLVVGEGGGGGGFSLIWIIAIVVVIAALAAGGAFAYRSMKGRSDF